MAKPRPAERAHLTLNRLLEVSGVGLATASQATVGTRLHRGTTWGQHAAPHATLAELVGVSRRSVWRWSLEGIPLVSAEHACDALGLHPCQVWGDEWIDAVLGGCVESVGGFPQ